MGELIRLDTPYHPEFKNVTHMLNTWWKTQETKPLVKPARIRHIVETAIHAGWSLNDCYEALSTTWAFTEPAFETALRKQKEEQENKYGPVGKRILRLRKERKNGERQGRNEPGRKDSVAKESHEITE